MQGVTYLVVAYAIAWIGLFAYIAFLTMRVRSVRTELAAVTELVREQQEIGKAQSNGPASWEAAEHFSTLRRVVERPLLQWPYRKACIQKFKNQGERYYTFMDIKEHTSDTISDIQCDGRTTEVRGIAHSFACNWRCTGLYNLRRYWHAQPQGLSDSALSFTNSSPFCHWLVPCLTLRWRIPTKNYQSGGQNVVTYSAGMADCVASWTALARYFSTRDSTSIFCHRDVDYQHYFPAIVACSIRMVHP